MEISSYKLFLSTALERSQKFHIIKYKTLIGNLTILNNQNFFKNCSQNILEFLSKLKSHDLIKNCSDFFWSLVHRLSNAIDKKDKEEIEKTYIYFLLCSFDSFYFLLPAYSKIWFIGWTNKKIILPKLNISVGFYAGTTGSLCKMSDVALEYKLDKFDNIEYNRYEIHFCEIPSWFKLRSEIICDKIMVLYQRHENIFEEHYCQDCCEDIFLGHLMKNKIERAFSLIKMNDNDLYEKLVLSIDYIIPYGNDPKKKYPNFAIATLKKTIFLSIDLLSEHDIFIAECIIHEYSHCELHLVQDTVLLTNIENNILEYYSPWRKDPRPLLGVIHAIYISNVIIRFYYTYLKNKNNSMNETVLVQKKVEIIIHQVLIALKQIKQNQLTEFTKELLDFIQQSILEISSKLFVSVSNPPHEIISHKEIWKFKNKELIIID